MFITSDLYLEDVKRVAGMPLPWDKLDKKSILLTGASGMLGTFLIDVLMYKKSAEDFCAKIFAVGRNEEKAKERFAAYWKDENFSFVCADLNDSFSVGMHADYVIHAASNTHPRLYASDPVGSLMTNILGTYHLLEYARGAMTERFVFVSSVEVYGQALKPEDVFDEAYCGYLDCNQFRAAYPEGKRAGEALCNAYIGKYEMDIVIPRLSRVYGPTMRLDDSKAMSQFLMNGVRGEDIVLKSKGNIRHLLSNPYFEFIRHDVTEPIRLEVDQIYNLACPASPIHYQYNPIKTAKTSVMGALNMLGLAKRTKARILQASTSEVYGDPQVHPQQENMRESPAIAIIRELMRRGSVITAYDPKAVEEAKTRYLQGMPEVSYADSKYEALKGADALLLVTEWKKFRQPDFEEIAKLLKQPLIFDGRNQYDKKRLAKYGIEYHQIGVA